MGLYWTGNEIDVAQGLRELYYLYLLPVRDGGRFEVDNLEVIRDPWWTVLGATSEWIVETEVVHCSLGSGVRGDAKERREER